MGTLTVEVPHRLPVSMKSGLRDRNNCVPAGDVGHHAGVSMKSGLRDRNNH